MSRPPRVVVFGGDIRKLSRDLAGLEDLELFGSTGQTGQGEVDAIRKLCRALGRVYLDRRPAPRPGT